MSSEVAVDSGHMFKGIASGLSGALCMASMIKFVHTMPKSMDALHVSAQQTGCLMLIALLFNSLTNGEELYPSSANKRKIAFWRGLIGGPSALLNILGSKNLPPPISIILLNCNVYCAIIIRSLITKTFPKLNQVGLSLLFLFGVVVLVAPELLFGQTGTIKFDFNPWYLLCPFFSGLLNAVITNMMQLSKDSLTPAQNSFWLGLFTPLYSGFCLSGTGASTEPLLTLHTLMFPLLGLVHFSYQSFLALACKFEKRASVLSPLISMNIVFIFVFEALSGKQTKMTDYLGAAIVFFTVCCLAVIQDKK